MDKSVTEEEFDQWLKERGFEQIGYVFALENMVYTSWDRSLEATRNINGEIEVYDVVWPETGPINSLIDFFGEDSPVLEDLIIPEVNDETR